MRTSRRAHVSKNLWLVTGREKTGITAFNCRDCLVPIHGSKLMAVNHLRLHYEHFSQLLRANSATVLANITILYILSCIYILTTV